MRTRTMTKTILTRMMTLTRIRMMKMDPKVTTKKENTMKKKMMRSQIDIKQSTLIKLYSTS